MLDHALARVPYGRAVAVCCARVTALRPAPLGDCDMPSLKDIVEAMGASWPAALAIFIASVALLGADHLEMRYLQALPSWSLGAAFISAITSGSILIVALLQQTIGLAMRPIRRRRYKAAEAAHVESLNDLPQPEMWLLAWAVANQTQVFAGPYFNPYIKALIAKGLLQIPGGHHHTDETPLLIPDHIWKALKDDWKNQPQLQELVGLRPFDRWQ